MRNTRLSLALALLGVWGCSGNGDTNPINDVTDGLDSVQDTAAPETAAPDSVDSDNNGQDISDTDTEPPPPPPEWTAIPLGAAGDLHQIRFLDEHGFVIVGDKGTILRPQGTGWIRSFAPHSDGALHDVALHQGQLHAVGDAGAWLVQKDTGAFEPWESTIVVNLYGVASLADGLVAVGQDGNVIRRHENTLKYEQVNPAYHLNAIASAGNGEAFVAATGGLVLRRGLEAGECTVDSGDMCASCSTDEECSEGMCRTFLGADQPRCTRGCQSDSQCPKGMACVHQGDAPHCQSPPVVDWFDSQVGPEESPLHDVFVLDPFNVWAVGNDGFVIRFSGLWTEEPCQETRNLHAVGGGAGRLYAVGDSGAFLHRNSEGEWPVTQDLKGPLLLEERYQGIAVGGERVVAVGTNGALQSKLLPEGAFEDAFAQPESAILDIAVRGDDAALVGENGVLVWLDESGYGALHSGTSVHLHSAHINSNGVMWAVGDEGTVLKRAKAGGISTLNAPSPANLFGVVSTNGGTVFVVGQAGSALLVHPESNTITLESTGQSHDLLDVFMEGSSPVAVGRNGTILRRTGGQWESIPSGTTANLHAGHSNGELSIAVGAQGSLVHWSADGGAATQIVDPALLYFDVFVQNDGSAILAGWAGTLQKRNSSGEISAMNTPTDLSIHAVNMYQEQLLVGGSMGTLWQRTGDP